MNSFKTIIYGYAFDFLNDKFTLDIKYTIEETHYEFKVNLNCDLSDQMKRYLTAAIIISLLYSGCENNETPPKDNFLTATRTPSKQPNILFLLADDWSYPHAGVYGDPVIRTPTFDRLASEGALFDNAFCAAPSCSPSRAAILTGRYPHQLESAGNLWSVIPNKFPNWVSILEEGGYHTGKSQKGWGPGDFKRGGYTKNPAGNDYASFEEFLNEKNDDQPFCFWFGSTDPHRSYERNAGVKTGMKSDDIVVPGFLPDLECVRNDMMDYFFEVERFDRECGNIIRLLERKGFLENTLIVMTSDNGMPFPRAKANLYDYGTRMPLAMYWKGKIRAGTRIDDFMNFIDFGPTFLEATGIDVPESFSGRSLMPLLDVKKNEHDKRDKVFLERERHANVRKGDLSYPCRAIRTQEYLYIRNFEPGRWPAGEPETHQSVGQYGDVDNSISKFLIMEVEGKETEPDFFKLAFSKRSAEELYILADDPYNLNNVAANSEYEDILDKLRADLEGWMKQTNDLRITKPQTTYWDLVEYTPDYQRYDFDLVKRIEDYKMLTPAGYGRYEEVPCK